MVYIYKSLYKPYYQSAKIISSLLKIPNEITDDITKKGLWILFSEAFINKNILKEVSKNPYVIVQLENLIASEWFNTPEYHEFIKKATYVWDYTSNFKYGYSKIYEIENEESKPIDVLFYGAINERRKKILSQINNITILDSNDENSWYPKLWNKIRQSKIVLSVHYYNPSNNDLFRLAPLLSNRTFVIAEECSLDKDYNTTNSFVTCKYEQIPELCEYFLKNPEKRLEWQNKGYEYILQNPIKIPSDFKEIKNTNKKKTKICHVVFSSNRKRYLERTFASKNKINYENLEVHKIFIDDYPLNRNDQEIIELAKHHGFNEIILHEENLGISKTWQEFFDLVKNRNFDYILHHEDDVELTEEVKIYEIINLLEQNSDLYQIQLKRNNWYPHETETNFKKDSDIIVNSYRLEKQDIYFWMLFSIYPAWITKEPILKETGNNPAEGVISYYLKSKYNLTGGILKTLDGDIMVNHFGEYTQGKRCLEMNPDGMGLKFLILKENIVQKQGKK